MDGEGRHDAGAGQRRGRRRRRRKQTKADDSTVVLRTFGVALLCAMLVVFGMLLGLNYRPDTTTAERYRLAVEAQEAERKLWLTECGEKGYSEWTCNRFDLDHITLADRLDKFHCESTDNQVHYCQYVLGDAKVTVAIPTSTIVFGDYETPELRARAVIDHSDAANEYYVSISESGRIELREREADVVRLVINPSTGTLREPDVRTPLRDEAAANAESESTTPQNEPAAAGNSEGKATTPQN